MLGLHGAIVNTEHSCEEKRQQLGINESSLFFTHFKRGKYAEIMIPAQMKSIVSFFVMFETSKVEPFFSCWRKIFFNSSIFSNIFGKVVQILIIEKLGARHFLIYAQFSPCVFFVNIVEIPFVTPFILLYSFGFSSSSIKIVRAKAGSQTTTHDTISGIRRR